MDDEAILNLFRALYDDIKREDEFPSKRPFLAHYTSLDALENILSTKEIWFSNPLFMNDLEEVTFGFVRGATNIKNNDNIRTDLETETGTRDLPNLLNTTSATLKRSIYSTHMSFVCPSTIP